VYIFWQTKPTFYGTLGKDCYTAEMPDLDFIRIVGEDGDQPLPGVDGIDIAKADLHKFTNSAGSYWRRCVASVQYDQYKQHHVRSDSDGV
jgi:hypothetical protein